jgi:hypothetical protein
MTLPASGAISLSQVNTEMSEGLTIQRSINDIFFTTLTGGTNSWDDLHGKSRSHGAINISSGMGSWTVPLGVINVYVHCQGGHGGKGGTDVYAGQVGWDGMRVYGNLAVSYGQVFHFFVGNNGTNGTNGRSGTHGKGGSSSSPTGVNFSGGNGGDAGTYYKSNSGGGAGGGGASGVYLGTTPIIIAGGGGGGAGAGHEGGIKAQQGGIITSTIGGTGYGGTNADYGGCGGGGGGLNAGQGGQGAVQDYFGWPGTNGGCLVPGGFTKDNTGQNDANPYVYLTW